MVLLNNPYERLWSRMLVVDDFGFEWDLFDSNDEIEEQAWYFVESEQEH